jgi:MFS family permease
MREDKDRYIGYVEIALGVGDVIGPAIGGFCFGSFGFVGTFLVFGAMILTGIILSMIWIPSSLNKMNTKAKLEEQQAAIEL